MDDTAAARPTPKLQTPSIMKGNAAMAKIRSNKEFRARIDEAFETQKTRDEAKRCYEFERQELKDAESELCDYAAQYPEMPRSGNRVSCRSTRAPSNSPPKQRKESLQGHPGKSAETFGKVRRADEKVRGRF